MTPHCRIYFKHFGYTEADFIPCEVDGSKAVDIHHIHGRGKGKDVIENLQALCRPCHVAAHSGVSKAVMQAIHDKHLLKWKSA